MKNKKRRRFKREGKFYTYIVECRDGTYYAGYTPDIEKRIKLHNDGKGAKYTRDRRPVRLAWSKEYKYFKLAFLEEKRVKALTREQKEKLVNEKINKFTPKSKRRRNLSAGNASTLRSPDFGVATKRLKVYIKTFGCQMNVRDSEVICGLLKKAGYKICADEKAADVIIFNTCSVRQHADDRVWSQIGSFKKGQSPSGTVPSIIGVVGCMAKNYAEKIFERSPNVDFVAGPQDIDKIPEILSGLSQNKGQSPFGDSPLFLRKIWEVDGSVRPDEIYHNKFYQDKEHAYLVISEGCSNFCSYCIVPYVRGPLRHRECKNILKEAGDAVAAGLTKITLLGQNVNAYKDGNINFTKLLQRLDAMNGLRQLSFFTSHPKDANLDFFKAIRDSQKLVKSLHLPLQSGSDRILRLMNRGYSAKEYLALIDSYRKIVKGGLLTTDIIVGFPGESEDDFRQTYDLVEKAEFNAAYIFKYSPRPHTGAAKMADDVERQEKEKWHSKILELQRGISHKKNARQK